MKLSTDWHDLATQEVTTSRWSKRMGGRGAHFHTNTTPKATLTWRPATSARYPRAPGKVPTVLAATTLSPGLIKPDASIGPGAKSKPVATTPWVRVVVLLLALQLGSLFDKKWWMVEAANQGSRERGGGPKGWPQSALRYQWSCTAATRALGLQGPKPLWSQLSSALEQLDLAPQEVTTSRWSKRKGGKGTHFREASIEVEHRLAWPSNSKGYDE